MFRIPGFKRRLETRFEQISTDISLKNPNNRVKIPNKCSIVKTEAANAILINALQNTL